MTPSEIRQLLRELKQRQRDDPQEYRAGYIDALQYVLDWMEEDE